MIYGGFKNKYENNSDLNSYSNNLWSKDNVIKFTKCKETLSHFGEMNFPYSDIMVQMAMLKRMK